MICVGPTPESVESGAGPAIGDSARKGYIEKNVDSVTKLNSLYKGFPGEYSRIATYNKCMFQGYYLVDATVKKVV